MTTRVYTFQGFVRTTGYVWSVGLLRMAGGERCSGRGGVIGAGGIGRVGRAIDARGEAALKSLVLAGESEVVRLQDGGG
jgi:hypothetical protein